MKRVVAIGLLLVLAAILIFFGLGRSSRGPTYCGKPLKVLVVNLTSPVLAARTEAENCIRTTGPGIVPDLIRLLQTRDSLLQQPTLKIARLLPSRLRAKLIKRGNFFGPMQLRTGAARALELLGPAAAPAVPFLAKALSDPSSLVSQHAAQALTAVGPLAVEPLTQILTNSHPYARALACNALAALGPSAAAAAPGLVTIARDPAHTDQALARDALAKIGVAAMRPLLRELSRERSHSADLAAALAAVASRDYEALLLLIRELPLQQGPSRIAVIDALSRVRPMTRRVLLALATALSDDDPAIASAARSALLTSAQNVTDAPAVLARMTDEPDRETKRWALATLGQLGAGARAALPAVKKFVNDPDDLLRKTALEAIQQMEATETPK